MTINNNSKDFLFFKEDDSAKKLFIKATNRALLYILATFIAIIFLVKILFTTTFIVSFSALIALLYLILFLLKIYIIFLSIKKKSKVLLTYSDDKISAAKDSVFKKYTVIIPLYQESEVVSQIKKSMTALDYPQDKIEFIITLEEYDHETREALEGIGLPNNWRIITLPNVTPKTKPKALNVALLEATGEYIVIYDAEIIPDQDQLKKAAIAFSEFPEIVALQSRLDHYNYSQSLITKLFNAEFTFYYDFFLPGVQVLGVPLPLSGHSAHFRKSAIISVGGWDPYNVTEDVEIALRLHRKGYLVSMLDSYSYEEATVDLVSWIKQRTRWVKGFLQTTLVHIRHPRVLIKELGGYRNFFLFGVLMPLTSIINIFNFTSTILLTIWLLFRPAVIQSFFNLPVLYLSYTVSILGIFISTYFNLFALYNKRRFSIVKHSFLSPIYWFMLSIAGIRAIYQLFFSPTSWEKTRHGRHLSIKK